MNDDRAFERATSHWLEAGSDRTPPPVIDAVLLAVRTTPQERDLRIPWRTPRMSNRMRLAAAVAVVAVVGIAGLTFFRGATGTGGPSPSPIASPTLAPTPAPTHIDTTSWTTVTSARFGISYKVPPSWTTTPATAPWIWQAHDPGPQTTDTTVDSQQQGFLVASQKIPAGMSADAWWADYLGVDTSNMPTGCFPKDRSGYRMTTVDGQTAYIHGELPQCNFTEAIVVTGGRAYQLTAQPDVRVPIGKVFNAAMFDAWLGTIHFDPTSADDTPVASPAATP